MHRSYLPLFVSVGLLGMPGCIMTTTNNNSSNPGDNAAGGGDSASGDSGSDGSGSSSRVRDMTGTKTVGGRSKARMFKASAPPQGGTWKDKLNTATPAAPPSGGGAAAPVISGFTPTAASAGTLVEIFGENFGDDIGKVSVDVGGVAWTPMELFGDRVVATVPDGAVDGQVKVTVDGKSSTSEGTFSVLEDDGGLTAPAPTLNGLVGEVFVPGGQFDTLPDFSTLGDPTAVIAVEKLDIPTRDFKEGFPGVNGDVVEWFAIRFTGSLNIVDEGEYNLCLNSDDGSRLLLEDQLVVDNDGTHSTREKCELVFLPPGEYKLQIDYFQGPRHQIALQFSWAKDGGDKQIVPSEALFRPANGI